ncbi:MAG: T9SS type A sorting domain-containing protein, partial [Bacteroidota bacterium]|nr:T9SS type A sorting domain-containing protein [Bacteroidota bacterium]MDX5431649.1 T9SS type A sorting domain-containing protein [Bacteroidota bacterium]MDX5470367.1 T9SS type A sorting domain-containing protein [Bacteroidota bacterium]
TIEGSSTSKLSFTGSTASTLNMDQTTSGTTNVLQNLTVNGSGGLTLGNSLQLIGVLTLSNGTLTTGGNLRLIATSPTAYGQISPDGSGSISGSITMEKELSNVTAGWRQIALPLTNTLDQLTGINMLDTTHSTANQRNVYLWDASQGSVTNESKGWRSATLTSDNQTSAYAVYGNNSSNNLHDIKDSLWFTGTYTHSASASFNIYDYLDPLRGAASNASGWNLIPNPYPSNISLSYLFYDNDLSGLTYKGIHVWDAVNNQYLAIMKSGANINYNTSNTSSNTILAPFQAFWVKADGTGTGAGNTTFTVPKAARVTRTDSLGTFMKRSLDLARLDVYDKDQKRDQMVVYFESEASSQFDPSYDAYKLLSLENSVPSIYSVSPEGLFSINALNSNQFTHSVPVGFRSNKTGNVNFSLNTTELDQKWFVYLEDKSLGIFYDLREKPYSFNHSQNSDTRFVLHFQTWALSAEKVIGQVDEMQISGDGDQVFVFNPSHFREQNFKMEVYDLSGRLVLQNQQLQLMHGMNKLNLALPQSFYIVKITCAEGTYSGKVFIR